MNMNSEYEVLVNSHPASRLELDHVYTWYQNHNPWLNETEVCNFIREVLMLVDTGQTVFDAVETLCLSHELATTGQLLQLFGMLMRIGPSAQRYWQSYSRLLAEQFCAVSIDARTSPGLKPEEHGALLLLAVESVLVNRMLPSKTRSILSAIANHTAKNPGHRLWQTVAYTCLEHGINAPLVNFVLMSASDEKRKGTSAEWIADGRPVVLIEQGLRRFLHGVSYNSLLL